MDTTQLILGTVLMVLGVTVVIVAVFRSLNHQWAWGIHELWLLPGIGIVLVGLGRWLIQ